jgi:hypothetical protein
LGGVAVQTVHVRSNDTAAANDGNDGYHDVLLVKRRDRYAIGTTDGKTNGKPT